jgi:hypothetical protein
MESFASRLEMIRKRSVSHTSVDLMDGPEQEARRMMNGNNIFFISQK